MKTQEKARKMISLSVPVELEEKFSETCKKSYTSKTQAIINLMLEYIRIKEEGHAIVSR